MGELISTIILVIAVTTAEIITRRNGNGRAKDQLIRQLSKCVEQHKSSIEVINENRQGTRTIL